MFYFARCMNVIFNSLLVQLVKYDVHTTCEIKSIHAIFYHLLLFYYCSKTMQLIKLKCVVLYSTSWR